jgi:hypothetical protein
MPAPTRDTSAGRIHNDLRNLARRDGAVTDQVVLEYLLERFLYRVSVHALGGQHFVLKGGLLLAQSGARRITRGIDILGRAFPGDEEELIRRITQIAATNIDDGVTFEPDTVTTVPIRQDDEYHGLRLAMSATLGRASLKLQLDVSFGDPVTPAPTLIEYPQSLGDETFTLYGYPLATVIAEKVSTAIALGISTPATATTPTSTSSSPATNSTVTSSLPRSTTPPTTAASNCARSAKRSPTCPPDAKRPTRAWRRRQGRAAENHPEDFAEIVATVIAFADPLATDASQGRTWFPHDKAWLTM